MVEWNWRAAAISVLVVAALVLLAYWAFGRSPTDPQELFRRRCSNCHRLPDMTGYRRSDIRPIVTTMLERKGADAVISRSEAERIIAYLEEISPP